NNFTAATSINSVPSKPDANNKGAKFSLAPDDKYSQANSLEKPTADNVSKEIRKSKEAVNESPDKFTQSMHKTAKSENPHKSENKTKQKEQITNSDTIKQPGRQKNLIHNRLAKNSVAVEHSNLVATDHSKEGAVAKIEPKAGRQPAQIINNTPAGKPPPVTGHAVKSAEIKLLHATEKGQLGIKTVLPATSNGQNGLKAVLPDTSKSTPASKKQPETTNNTDKISVSAKTIAETKSVTEKENTKELVPEVPANTSKSTNVSTGQTKDQGATISNKSTSQGFEQMLSHNTSQTVITEQTPVVAKNTMTSNKPDQNSSCDVSADIGKQILESVQRSISQQGTDQQITVRLNPPELGKVLIKFQQHNSELTGLMEVSKTQTRVEIEQTLPQIIRNLADSGIHIKRLEVTLSNEEQSGQETLGNQSLQSGGSQQQYSGNPGTSGNDMDVQDSNEWSAGNNSYENLSELQEALIADGSINLLI
ncbi:MAG: flagellar hook-length control protein FliK, partial [Planctomycetota bacterium]